MSWCTSSGKLQSALRKGSSKQASETQISEANIVDFLAEPHVLFSVDDQEPVHECNVVVTGLAEVLSVKNSPELLSSDKLYLAALDSACNRSCAGSSWVQHAEEASLHAPPYIRSLVKKEPESERFRFGNGGVLRSSERIRLPFLIAGRVVLLWVSNVPCPSLGCLVGKDALDALGALHDFLSNRVQFQLLAPDHWVRLSRMNAGHSSISFLPTPLSQWPPLTEKPWIAIGRGKVCEVQSETRMQWMLKKLKRAWTGDSSGHETQVTEHFVPELLAPRLQADSDGLCPYPVGGLVEAIAASRFAMEPDCDQTSPQEHVSPLVDIVQRPFLRGLPLPLPSRALQ